MEALNSSVISVQAAGVEFVCVPHAADYDGYRGWKVPAKKPGAFRVAMVHALNSTIYTGPDEESDSRTGAIEDDFFTRFAVDYLAECIAALHPLPRLRGRGPG